MSSDDAYAAAVAAADSAVDVNADDTTYEYSNLQICDVTISAHLWTSLPSKTSHNLIGFNIMERSKNSLAYTT